jgi:hypothetical protein
VSSSFASFSLAVLLLALVFTVIAGFLVWYALQRNDEVRARFGHGKTIFELETKKRRGGPEAI